ncbi:hypothetical protein ACHAWO_005870 [Cyclotella atomus]|uniref:Uncharacterized protein n=1 Tax=Cyclotella atomus TaxID=382360 RepID=A0ABD3Q670_9STRA
MLANRNHKQIKMTSRSHSMPPRRQSETIRGSHGQNKYSASLRAEVVSEDEALQRMLSKEIEKARVVTQQGFNAVHAKFLQCQAVTGAVRRREDENKHKKTACRQQRRKNANPFQIAAGNIKKSVLSSRQIVPYKAEENDPIDRINLALQKSVPLSEDEEEQLDRYDREYQKRAEKQRLVDSFLASYRSEDEVTDCQIPPTKSRSDIKSRKMVGVKEVIIADCMFKRTSSSSSLELRDIFEEIDSDDDETSQLARLTLNHSALFTRPVARKISSDKGTSTWLLWSKKNDGDKLLVSFPSIAGNDSSAFLAWPQDNQANNEGSWERH